jgi:hypothetical protein
MSPNLVGEIASPSLARPQFLARVEESFGVSELPTQIDLRSMRASSGTSLMIEADDLSP